MEHEEPTPSPVLLRLQRNAWLFALIGAAFILGNPITRFLESYRGVVLDVNAEQGQMYVAFAERLPRWINLPDNPNVAPGTLIDKTRGEWNPQPAEAKSRDLPLVQLFKRFDSTYDAIIVRIDPPVSPGLPATAVIEIDGHRQRIPLGSENLATAAAGRRLRKLPKSWDPILLDEEPAASAPH